MTRVRLTEAQRAAIARGAFVRVMLERAVEIEGLGAPARSVLLGRVGERWRAFANVCRHRALPLDFGVDSAMSEDGAMLVCSQHGATYRVEDGVCVAGPCVGERLARVDVADDAEGAIVVGGARRP